MRVLLFSRPPHTTPTNKTNPPQHPLFTNKGNNCSADRRTAGAFRAIAWTLNNATLRSVRQVAVKNARGAFEFEVTLPATVAWSAQGTAQLCLTTSDRTGTAVNPCPTLQTMCPDAGGCPVWFASQPFVQPSNRKRVTCCTTPASRQLAYGAAGAAGPLFSSLPHLLPTARWLMPPAVAVGSPCAPKKG